MERGANPTSRGSNYHFISYAYDLMHVLAVLTGLGR